MAQPVFEEHPLEEYLREAGEDVMPGATPEFAPVHDQSYDERSPRWSPWMSERVKRVSKAVAYLISAIHPTTTPSSRFSEQFQYSVISSTLLSSTLPGPPSSTNPLSPTVPGRLPRSRQSSYGHNDLTQAIKSPSSSRESNASEASVPGVEDHYIYATLVVLGSMAFVAGYYSLVLILLGSAVYYSTSIKADSNSQQSPEALSLEALNQLVAAGNVWDQTVNEAISTLEADERSSSYNSPTPASLSSPLRIALHSSLQTTQTQCDNVRHLLSALTSPHQLSQLSEMYAPPSPPQPSFAPLPLASVVGEHGRPASCPDSMGRRRDGEEGGETGKKDKRATWTAGSYTEIASAGSPTKQVLKRREKRRSDLTALLQISAPSSSSPSLASKSPSKPSPLSLSTQPSPALSKATSLSSLSSGGGWCAVPPLSLARSKSAPGSPGPQVTFLPGVQEEDAADVSTLPQPSYTPRSPPLSPPIQEEGEDEEGEEGGNYFGMAALNLQRKRRTAGIQTFGISRNSSISSLSSSYRSSVIYSPIRRSATTGGGGGFTPSFQSSSKFTSLHTSRHPLSLSALHLALQGALSSKRYACSHLLALRFGSGSEDPSHPNNVEATSSGWEGRDEVEEEGYWEDVRSVMGLLTSTFADASARLSEALDEVERERVGYEVPSTGHSREVSRDLKVEEINRLIDKTMEEDEEGGRQEGSGIRSRLMEREREEGGREVSFAPMPSHLTRFATHMEAISSALTDAREHLVECVESLRKATSADGTSVTHSAMDSTTEGPPALQAYERLRREIGLALRECERGRERLLDILAPPKSSPPTDDDGVTDEDELPPLGPDGGSDESDKHDSFTPLSLDPPQLVAVVEAGRDEDDVTSHLLLGASSQHLPPVGIEQVFESDSAGGIPFTRERSKLSREERIKQAKARRESGSLGLGLGLPSEQQKPSPLKPGIERWGPGGDVVQELKDVIWKVGERRRKMSEGSLDIHSAAYALPPRLPPFMEEVDETRTFS